MALDSLKALEDGDLLVALEDPSPGMREHAVRLAEPRLAASSELLSKVLALADDPDTRVRFQVAFTLGETTDARAIQALAAIATRNVDEPWIRTAVLSSSAERADRLLTALAADEKFAQASSAAQWLEQLAAIVGRGGVRRRSIACWIVRPRCSAVRAASGRSLWAWVRACNAGQTRWRACRLIQREPAP